MQDATTTTAEPEDAMTAPGFEHRLVRAADAPPMPSPGVRSVFDLAQQTQAPAAESPAEKTPAMAGFKTWLQKKGQPSAEGRAPIQSKKPRKRADSKAQAALDLMKTGPVSFVEVSKILGITDEQAATLLRNLVFKKLAVRLPKTSRDELSFVALPGHAGATPAPAPKPANRGGEHPSADARVCHNAHQPALRCALFNTGHLHVEVEGQPALLLDRGQARDLVAFLDQISSALAGEV